MRFMGQVKLSLVGLADRANAPRLEGVVLVNGFWRSGTTWLQQCLISALRAKSLFEPFSPAAGHKWAHISDTVNEASRQIYLPLSQRQLSPGDLKKLDLSFRGIGTHGFTHFLRSGVSEAWSNKLVVKFTRLGFVLGHVADTYAPMVLHIRRNPAAVYASFKETNWQWRFKDVRFRDIYNLEDHEPGSSERELVDVLLRHDDAPDRRLAALWSLSERSAQETIDSGKSKLINYDELLLDRKNAICSLGIPEISNAISHKASPVSNPGREKISAAARINDWKRRLTRSEIATLDSIVRELFPRGTDSFRQPVLSELTPMGRD